MSQELDLTNLRKVAEAATPGPWVPVPAKRDSGGYEPFYAVKVEGRLLPITYAHQDWEGFGNGSTKANATHIATFDPPTVLALITQLEQQTSTVKALAERNVELTKFKDAYALQAQELEQAEQAVAALTETITRLRQGDGDD